MSSFEGMFGIVNTSYPLEEIISARLNPHDRVHRIVEERRLPYGLVSAISGNVCDTLLKIWEVVAGSM